MSNQIVEQIQNEFERRVFDESYSRIEKCLEKLTEEQVWKKTNKNTNSIGNLILHLLGNVRQYICSGIGRQEDIRNRPLEFHQASQIPKHQLEQGMFELQKDVLKVIEGLSETQLLQTYKVQGFTERGVAIVIHVIEHFSYHVGQIAQSTKLIKDEDLGFYTGIDLNVTD